MRAGESASARLNPELNRAGLTESQFGVLEALLHLGPLCQVDLGRKLLKSGGNVTTVVDNLERRGLVRRERRTDDRRFVRVHLTPAGADAVSQVLPEHVARIVDWFSVLSPDEMETLRVLCRRLGLQEGARPGGSEASLPAQGR